MNAASRTLSVGHTARHRAGRVIITVGHPRSAEYTVTVEHATTGTIVDELTSGPWLIEADARNAARNAYRAFVTGRTVEQVLTDLADASAVLTAVAEIVDAAPSTNTALVDLASLGTRRQVRPTMAGAHLADLSDPQRRELAEAAITGRTVIYRGGGVSNSMLIALARKGYGQLVYRNTRKGRTADHLILNARAVREGAEIAGQVTR